MSSETLKTLVIGFRRGMLQGRGSVGMCYMMCAPLHGFLQMHGYATELICGEVYEYEHFWLQLPNGDVIDPTADQFGKPDGSPMPPIYIGPLPTWYFEKTESCR